MSDRARPSREALLDAAYDAAVSADWAAVRMADVARAAGLSRQTLYNEFGSKDELAAALAAREGARYIDGTVTAMSEEHPRGPVAAVVAAVRFTLQRAGDDRLLKAVLTDDTGGLLPYLTTRAEPLLVSARARICEYLLGHWPELDPADVALIADAVFRLTVSYLVLPSDAPDASPEAVADRVGRLVRDLLHPDGRRTS